MFFLLKVSFLAKSLHDFGIERKCRAASSHKAVSLNKSFVTEGRQGFVMT